MSRTGAPALIQCPAAGEPLMLLDALRTALLPRSSGPLPSSDGTVAV
jgi:hypothetical protein